MPIKIESKCVCMVLTYLLAPVAERPKDKLPGRLPPFLCPVLLSQPFDSSTPEHPVFFFWLIKLPRALKPCRHSCDLSVTMSMCPFREQRRTSESVSFSPIASTIWHQVWESIHMDMVHDNSHVPPVANCVPASGQMVWCSTPADDWAEGPRKGTWWENACCQQCSQCGFVVLSLWDSCFWEGLALKPSLVLYFFSLIFLSAGTFVWAGADSRARGTWPVCHHFSS